MDFWELLKVVARRWVFALPVLLLSAVAAVLVPPTIQPTYTASATTVVVPPADGEPSQNPYLALGATTMAQAIGLSADSATAMDEVTQAGNSTSFEVTLQNSRQPILVITAQAPDPQVAVSTVEQVLGIVDAQLQERQVAAGAPPTSIYSTRLLDAAVLPVPVYEGAQRVRYLIIGLGVLLAVGLALLAEAVAVLRRRRRTGLRESMPTDLQLRMIAERMTLLDERERLLDEREQLLAARAGDRTDSPGRGTADKVPGRRSSGSRPPLLGPLRRTPAKHASVRDSATSTDPLVGGPAGQAPGNGVDPRRTGDEPRPDHEPVTAHQV